MPQNLFALLGTATPEMMRRVERVMRTTNPQTLANLDALLDGRGIGAGKNGTAVDLTTITKVQAAQILGVSPRTVRNMMKRGALRVVCLNGRNRILASSIREYIDAHAA